jgi:hypothetical protein
VILDQAKVPEWHAAMVAANIDIFAMSYEESMPYFKHLKNLGKIRFTNGPSLTLYVDNKKSDTSSAGIGKSNKSCKQWCHPCDNNSHNTADCRAIENAKQHKKTPYEAKAIPRRKSLALLFEEINAIKR